jgi:hypothetical protein
MPTPATKRLKVNPERETLRGLTRGSIAVRTSAEMEEVIVVGTSYPSWLPHLGTLGLRPSRIHVDTPTFLSSVRSNMSDRCLVSWGPMDWSSFSPTAAQLLLIDGKACNDALSYAERQGIRLIVATESRRKLPTGWAETRIAIDHAAVGGVTEKMQRIFIYERASIDLPRLDPAVCVPRDASTILFEKTYASAQRKAPENARVVPLRAEVIGQDSKGRDIYHGGGFFRGP